MSVSASPYLRYVAGPQHNAPPSKRFDILILHNTAWVHSAVILWGSAFCPPVGVYQASESEDLCQVVLVLCLLLKHTYGRMTLNTHAPLSENATCSFILLFVSKPFLLDSHQIVIRF